MGRAAGADARASERGRRVEIEELHALEQHSGILCSELGDTSPCVVRSSGDVALHPLEQRSIRAWLHRVRRFLRRRTCSWRPRRRSRPPVARPSAEPRRCRGSTRSQRPRTCARARAASPHRQRSRAPSPEWIAARRSRTWSLPRTRLGGQRGRAGGTSEQAGQRLTRKTPRLLAETRCETRQAGDRNEEPGTKDYSRSYCFSLRYSVVLPMCSRRAALRLLPRA